MPKAKEFAASSDYEVKNGICLKAKIFAASGGGCMIVCNKEV